MRRSRRIQNRGRGRPAARQAEISVLAINSAMVIGPTPPGTGVIAPSFSGAMAWMILPESRWPGNGSCTRVPWIAIGVQVCDQLEEIIFNRVAGQRVLNGIETALLRLLALGRDIDLACWVLAYDYHRQTGLHTAQLGCKVLHRRHHVFTTALPSITLRKIAFLLLKPDGSLKPV